MFQYFIRFRTIENRCSILRMRRLLIAPIRRRILKMTLHLPPFLLVIIGLSIFFSIQLIFFIIVHSLIICILDRCCMESSDIIVSLTTTADRFHVELPLTIHSLLYQTMLPEEIRIYVGSNLKETNVTLTNLKLDLQIYDSSKSLEQRFDKLVHLYYLNEDHGPAMKFLPIIEEYLFLSNKTREKGRQKILICDDDHYYHSRLVSTLNKYSDEFNDSIVGLRGWRGKRFVSEKCKKDERLLVSVREDLEWGVSGTEEYALHIVQSYYLSKPYRVGVLTANAGYLIRPDLFDIQIVKDFLEAPDDIRHVDDIWLNGHASKRHVPRYVVPSCSFHIHLTRTHTLQMYLSRNRMSRKSANEHALKSFEDVWEKDLWYKFRGVNGPQYRWWWTTIDRKWISIIQKLKFIRRFGFFDS